jgi:hypothetical protein
MNSIFKSSVIDKIIENGTHRYNEDQDNLQVPVVPLFFIFWSDDFDPSKSVKQNRNSVWIKTVTIFCCTQDGQRISSTYPISASRKGLDHEVVEKLFRQQLDELRSGQLVMMFSPSFNRIIRVHAEVYCILNDQIERRSGCKLLHGNGNLHARWLVRCDCKSLSNKIPSCDVCSASISKEVNDHLIGQSEGKNYSWRSGVCRDCSAWMYDIANPLLQFQPDNNFPQEMRLSNGNINSMQITATYLKQVFSHLFEKVMDGTYTEGNVESLLKFNCISPELSEKIKTIAFNCKYYEEAKKNKEEDIDTFLSLSDEKQQNPEMYEPFQQVSSWYYFDDLHRYVDAPMHLLPLGIIKTTLLKINQWLNLKKLNAAFQRKACDVLDEIRKLNLGWCKVLDYSQGTYGGWVSENFLGMSRLLDWFFSMLKLLPRPDPYEDPVTDFKTWTAKENRAWLRARGIDNSGNAAELKSRVRGIMESNNIPQIEQSKACDVSVVLEMIHSLQLLMSVTMRDNHDEQSINFVEAIIRQYLNYFRKMDDTIRNQDVPSWISHYNFLCLLNIPKLLREYGSLRHLWEGGNQGEGYLRNAKAELRPGLIRTWEVWLINNLLDERTFNNLLVNDGLLPDGKNKVNEFKIYPSKAKALYAIIGGRPLSAFTYQSDPSLFGVAYRDNGMVYAIHIVLSMNFTTFNNVRYHKLFRQKAEIPLDTDSNDLIGVLFLPLLCEDGYPHRGTDEVFEYCCIQSNWEICSS